VVGYVPSWFTCQQTVTHPSSNQARCRATTLIETNVLTTTSHCHEKRCRLLAHPARVCLSVCRDMPGMRKGAVFLAHPVCTGVSVCLSVRQGVSVIAFSNFVSFTRTLRLRLRFRLHLSLRRNSRLQPVLRLLLADRSQTDRQTYRHTKFIKWRIKFKIATLTYKALETI